MASSGTVQQERAWLNVLRDISEMLQAMELRQEHIFVRRYVHRPPSTEIPSPDCVLTSPTAPILTFTPMTSLGNASPNVQPVKTPSETQPITFAPSTVPGQSGIIFTRTPPPKNVWPTAPSTPPSTRTMAPSPVCPSAQLQTMPLRGQGNVQRAVPTTFTRTTPPGNACPTAPPTQSLLTFTLPTVQIQSVCKCVQERRWLILRRCLASVRNARLGLHCSGTTTSASMSVLPGRTPILMTECVLELVRDSTLRMIRR
jgi:hypothetical protein